MIGDLDRYNQDGRPYKPDSDENNADVVGDNPKDPPWKIAGRLADRFDLVQNSSGQVFLYNNQYWEPIGDHSLKHLLLVHGGRAAQSQHSRNAALDYLKASVHKRDLVWGRVADYEVPFANGVLDLRDGCLRSHEPNDCLESVVPHEYDRIATCPVWLETLDEWFRLGDDRTVALQEFFGYVCLPHARWKKHFSFWVPGIAARA